MSGELRYRLCCALVVADGVIDDREREFLAEYARQESISPEDAEDILDEVAEEQVARIPRIESEEERRRLFYSLLDVAKVDKRLHPKERAFLKRAGKALKIPEDEILRAFKGFFYDPNA